MKGWQEQKGGPDPPWRTCSMISPTSIRSPQAASNLIAAAMQNCGYLGEFAVGLARPG